MARKKLWPDDVLRRAMDVAAADPSVKRITLEMEAEGLDLTFDVRPMSVPHANGNGHFNAPVITEIIQNAADVQPKPKPGSIASLRGHSIGSLREEAATLPGFESPPSERKGRGPTWSQTFYYKQYALAVKDMKSPITLAQFAAKMVIGADTLRHYYYADPPRPRGRYKKSPGMGWGPAPGCRPIGE